MAKEVDMNQIERIVKRFKAAINVKKIIAENDVHTWMNIYSLMVFDIITLGDNECSIYDRDMLKVLYQVIKDDKEISDEDFKYLCDCIDIKRKTPGGHCS